MIRIGTAGWTIPRSSAEAFPPEGAGLARYAARLNAAEINSSFYRSHREATWRGWAERTPAGFRFAVKVPKAITHEAKLQGCEALLQAFLAEARLLGDRLGPLLVQLPPSLAFDPAAAEAFLAAFRALAPEPIACEPRHPSWFEADADALLSAHRIARAAADPPRHALAAKPGGWPGLVYCRLHGSPRMYWSAYEDEALERLAALLRADGPEERWCIFDNTGSGAAAADALRLKALLGAP